MRRRESCDKQGNAEKAAAEADQAIRDSLPAPAECEHEFSPSFQRKMRRTFRKAKHPVIYKLPKYAACFVLAVALASGTWLTVDAEARAAFLHGYGSSTSLLLNMDLLVNHHKKAML